MIRVNLQEITPTNGINKIIEMPSCPRVDDTIEVELGGACYTVRAVIWCPSEPDYDVQVRFR